MNISIFGTGYVGLVTGACLAESGHDVHCVDVDEDKIDLLNSGQIAIHEPGLKDLVASNLAAERIHFSTNPDVAIKHARVLMIAVDTPTDTDGSSDLQYVIAVAKNELTLLEVAPEWEAKDVQALTEPTLKISPKLSEIDL